MGSPEQTKIFLFFSPFFIFSSLFFFLSLFKKRKKKKREKKIGSFFLFVSRRNIKQP